jgi:cupin superfamily acireductone dioxygenase involved in methionine salvage
MKDFYGLDPHDREKQKKWCKEFNHNLLRITRIIRSARIFGLDEEADEFYLLAKEAGDFFGVSDKTKEYWKRARYDDVYKSLSY